MNIVIGLLLALSITAQGPTPACLEALDEAESLMIQENAATRAREAGMEVPEVHSDYAEKAEECRNWMN